MRIVLSKKALKLIMATLMVGLRKLRWVLHSVVNNIFIMVFHKDPFLVPCYLIFVICFLFNITSEIANYADDTAP